jgi:hypothetical protein
MTAPKTSLIESPHHSHTDDEIGEIATALAREAQRAASPGRSLGALIRWRYRAQGWSDEACARLLSLGLAEIDSLEADARSAGESGVEAPIAGVWLTVDQTARILHRSTAAIKRRLRTREGRREYGWPWWDGHRWLIPSPAICPTMRPSYTLSMPDEEPYPPPPFAES